MLIGLFRQIRNFLLELGMPAVCDEWECIEMLGCGKQESIFLGLHLEH
jgi:hypothetical protein